MPCCARTQQWSARFPAWSIPHGNHCWMRTHCHTVLCSLQFDKCLWGATYTGPIVMIMAWGCVLSFQAEGAESMYGNYFSLGTLVWRNPKTFFFLCFSACTPSLTLLSAFWIMNHRIIKAGEDVWGHQIQPLTSTTVLNMQLLCIGQLRAPAAEQFAVEGLFSGPQLKRFLGDGATEWPERIINAKLMAFTLSNPRWGSTRGKS